jgi:TQXA domain-containing protein
VPGLDAVSGLTGLVQNAPLAGALPSNVTKLPGLSGLPASPLVMQDKNGAVKEHTVTPVQIEQSGQRMKALPLAPESLLGGLPATQGLPLAQGLSPSGLSPESLSKITWVLQQTGGGLPAKVDAGPLTPDDVATATQAAVWHYSTGADLAPNRNSAHVTDLYKGLTGDKNVGVPATDATSQLPAVNAPTLPGLPSTGELTPSLTSLGGGLLGPFGLGEGLAKAPVELSEAPQGVQLVDEDANEVTEMRAGTKYYLHMPVSGEPGQAVMTVLGTPQGALGSVLSTAGAGVPNASWVVADPAAKLPMRKSSVANWGTGALAPGSLVGATCQGGALGVLMDNTNGKTPLDMGLDGNDVSVPAGQQVVAPVTGIAQGEAYDIAVTKGTRTVHMAGQALCEQASGVSPLRHAEGGNGGAGSASLPITGAEVGGVLAGGSMLLLAGLALFAAARKRRSA